MALWKTGALLGAHIHFDTPPPQRHTNTAGNRLAWCPNVCPDAGCLTTITPGQPHMATQPPQPIIWAKRRPQGGVGGDRALRRPITCTTWVTIYSRVPSPLWHHSPYASAWVARLRRLFCAALQLAAMAASRFLRSRSRYGSAASEH